MDRLFRSDRKGTQLAAVTLLAGLLLPYVEWCLADTPDNRLDNKSATRMGSGQRTADLLQEELRVLLADLGAPAYNIPTDFVEKVRRWTRLYQTRDRDEMELVLGSRSHDFEVVRQQVASAKLPPDLAFVTLVESHFQAGTVSPADNAGLWQFTRDTARRNGLKINAQIDERLDPRKSTEAACRYLLRLRDHLGQGSSLMLVLAAYNMGPGRLQQRMNQVENPSKRYDFWHLYRTRLLPAVTRTHLARLMAAILIGRDPQHFGFQVTTPGNLEAVSSVVSGY